MVEISITIFFILLSILIAPAVLFMAFMFVVMSIGIVGTIIESIKMMFGK